MVKEHLKSRVTVGVTSTVLTGVTLKQAEKCGALLPGAHPGSVTVSGHLLF